jgi:hypothetical protein
MTLLKNDHATLPFKTGTTVAVLGQAVNDTCKYLTGNYDGPMNESQVQPLCGGQGLTVAVRLAWWLAMECCLLLTV